MSSEKQRALVKVGETFDHLISAMKELVVICSHDFDQLVLMKQRIEALDWIQKEFKKELKSDVVDIAQVWRWFEVISPWLLSIIKLLEHGNSNHYIQCQGIRERMNTFSLA